MTPSFATGINIYFLASFVKLWAPS